MFRVIHFADLHLIEKRIEEYTDVVLVLYDKLRESKLTNFIAIAGDVFDNKVSLKPSEMMLFNNMVHSFLDLGACVLIMPGNHDCNMNDPNALDLISPLLSETKHPNLHFFPRPAIKEIEFKGIQMTVHAFSPIDKTVVMPPPKPDGRFHLAMVHEIIIPFHGTLPRLSVADLSKTYDLVVCGDIHKQELLAPNVAYCGSLVQQNIGEHPLDHGYFDWVVTGKKVVGRHVRIPNLLGSMLKVYLKDDQILQPDLINEVKVAQRIAIEHINCTPEFIESVKTKLKARYGINIERTTDKNKYVTEETKRDPEHNFAKMLVDHISKHPEGKKIMQLHDDIVHVHPPNNCHQWKPLYMEWTNMFGYDGDKKHWINFDLDKTFGITGPNKSGKSSIFDIMQFLLWNECERGSKTMVVNTRAAKYSCMIIIQSEDGNKYTINRWGSSGHPKVSLSKNGENITRPDIAKTYAMIEDIVGPYQNFLLITHQASDSSMFTSMSQEKQKQYITTLLGLDEVNAWKSEAKRRIHTERDIERIHGPRPKFTTNMSLFDRQQKAAVLTEKINLLSVNAPLSASQYESHKRELASLPVPPHGLDPVAELKSLPSQTSTPTQLSLENVKAELHSLVGTPKTADVISSIYKFMSLRPDEMIDQPPLTQEQVEAKLSSIQIDDPQFKLDDLKFKLRLIDPTPSMIPKVPNTLAAYKDAQQKSTTLAAKFAQLAPQSSVPPISSDQVNEELKSITITEPPTQATIDGWLKWQYDPGCSSCEHNRVLNQAPTQSAITKALADRTLWDRRIILIEYKKYWDFLALQTELATAKQAESDIRIAYYAATRTAMESQISQLQEYLQLLKYRKFYQNGSLSRSQWVTLQSDLQRAQRQDTLLANLHWLRIQRLQQFIRYNELTTIVEKWHDAITQQSIKTKLEAELKSLEMDIVTRMTSWDAKSAAMKEESRIATLYRDILVEFTNKYIEITYQTIASRVNRMLLHVCNDVFATSDGLLTINNLPIQFGSGFQKTIINVLLRIVFMQIINKPIWRDQQVIDEGLFTSLDRHHLHQFVNVFIPTIRLTGVKLILISHQEELLAKLGKIVILNGTTRIGDPMDPPKAVINRDAIFINKGRRWICQLCNCTADERHASTPEHLEALAKVTLQ